MSRREHRPSTRLPSTLSSRALLFAQALASLGAGCRTTRSTTVSPPQPDTGAVADSGVYIEQVDTGANVGPEDSGALADAVEDTTGLRSDLCPEEQPSVGAACAPRRYCIYPQHAMQGTSCRCLDRDEARQSGIAPRRWNCVPYEFVGVGPLSPPELDERSITA
ncbi:MAG: hypothetical protein JNK05_39190 [Myxococcales bacterium]|nr:hypothetical protein [Myxococcales bacterium]